MKPETGNPRDGTKRGMTLVEVFIALAIFIVVLVAIATFESNVFIYKDSVSNSFQTAINSQSILKTMLVEIRESAPGANGAFPVVTAGSTTLSFFSDPDNDNVEEQVTYSLIGTTLYKAIINPSGTPPTYSVSNQSTTTLLTNVRNGSTTPVFQYFDANYSGTSTPLAQPVTTTAVHLVRVNLTLDVDPKRAPSSVTYSVQASLRNLKTNL